MRWWRNFHSRKEKRSWICPNCGDLKNYTGWSLINQILTHQEFRLCFAFKAGFQFRIILMLKSCQEYMNRCPFATSTSDKAPIIRNFPMFVTDEAYQCYHMAKRIRKKFICCWFSIMHRIMGWHGMVLDIIQRRMMGGWIASPS